LPGLALTAMRAIVFDHPGRPDVLRLSEVPAPLPGPGEVRVRVGATALNRADLLQRQGKYPPPPGASPLLGLEMAGEVELLGSGTTGVAVGERVCALLPGGGYAEYVTVPAPLLLQLPAAMSFEDAAAVPEAFLTAYQALFLLGGLRAGQHVLVHAGASGVGTAAIQLARRAGATVHVTASAPKHALCRAIGAETTIDYRSEAFDARVREATSGHGADVILDFIGAPYLTQNVNALALDGRIVVLATMGGALAERFDVRALFARRGALLTSTLRNRSLAYKTDLTAQFRADAWPDFATGILRAVVDRVLDWSDAAEAHRLMEANANAGKLVLRVR
jgi:tumor protein p53-inducible protein 3